jgi:hypothetical protein
MNGFNLFDKVTLQQTKPENMDLHQYLLSTLKNIRSVIKKGGVLVITRGLEPDFEIVGDQEVKVVTLGRSTKLPKIKAESFDWQEPSESKSRVKDIYQPSERIDPQSLENALRSIGFKLRVFDFAQIENMGDIKIDSPSISSTNSVHQRMTRLQGVQVPFKYPAIVLEAI